MPLSAQNIRFGPFQLDLRAAELHHDGTKINLPEQPFQILAELVSHPGEVVTREELRQRLWRSDTFVDFEHGLNTAVKHLRELLGDSAEKPQYIETVPRRGYRLMVPVEKAKTPQAFGRRRVIWLPAFLLVLTIVAGLVWRQRLQERFRLAKIESLAVLPLENLSGNPDEEYFVDGMTEALITELGKVHALRVISRQSVMHYKGTNKTVPQIAKELNVDALVEGSTLRTGGKVRITTQLIQANPEHHLWSENYERNLGDVISLQGEVARTIASQIRVRLTPQEQTYLASPHPVQPQVLQLYLKGRFYWNERNQPALEKGLSYFQQAIERDPKYAAAHAALADTYLVLVEDELMAPQEGLPRAQAAAMKAVELDDTLAEGHCVLASLRSDQAEWSAAKAEFQHALELNPNYAFAHQQYAEMLMRIGQPDAALEEIHRARDLDPNSLVIQAVEGLILYNARRYDDAIAQLQKTLKMDPNFVMAHNFLGYAYEQKGQYDEALAEFRKLVALSDEGPNPAYLARTYAVSGNRREALRALSRLRHISTERYVSPYEFARVYAGLGDKDQVILWLQKAYAEHAVYLVWLKVDPRLDNLRDDPRFQDLVRRMNFPP
ncbi:MAG: tetratricopeptide repeat protein [Acidobacteriia bacterium]|nr:tetratricopeptide repeat protein [Terriglobia bacterium]